MLKTTEANIHAEKLIEVISTDYTQKIFYFCLKKTGNTFEAEDLSSDILINIIGELRKGRIPEHLSAWVWKIAKNRYYVWSKNKHNRIESVSGIDPIEYEIIDEYDVESEFIHNEDIKSLRRELAFISKEYREIIVAYYIDDRKVRDIARELNLPEGTVKTKLFNSRKILKESMDMAREFGVRSYKPEEVDFVKSGNEGYDGSPWKQLERKIPKNIILEAYHNPSTIEELAIELGVAMPYMEEEVAELEAVELLKKNGNKYETNMIILSKDAQKDIYIKRTSLAEKFFKTSCDIIKVISEDSKANNTVLLGGYQNFEELKWLFLLRITDVAGWTASNRDKYKSPPRPDGGYSKRPRDGKWDIMGFEHLDVEDSTPFIGMHGAHTYDVHFYNYKIMYKGLRERAGEVHEREGITLKKVVTGKIGECDMDIVNKLASRGFFKKEGDKYIPTFPVGNENKKFLEQLVSSPEVFKEKIIPLCNELFDIYVELSEYTIQRVSNEIPERFKDMLWFVLECAPGGFRGSSIMKGVESGYSKIPENIETSTIAMLMMV